MPQSASPLPTNAALSLRSGLMTAKATFARMSCLLVTCLWRKAIQLWRGWEPGSLTSMRHRHRWCGRRRPLTGRMMKSTRPDDVKSIHTSRRNKWVSSELYVEGNSFGADDGVCTAVLDGNPTPTFAEFKASQEAVESDETEETA